MNVVIWWFTLINSPLTPALQLVNMSGVLIGIFAMVVGGLAHQSVGNHQPGTFGWELALKNENASAAIFFAGLALFLLGGVWTAVLVILLLPFYCFHRRPRKLTE